MSHCAWLAVGPQGPASLPSLSRTFELYSFKESHSCSLTSVKANRCIFGMVAACEVGAWEACIRVETLILLCGFREVQDAPPDDIFFTDEAYAKYSLFAEDLLVREFS